MTKPIITKYYIDYTWNHNNCSTWSIRDALIPMLKAEEAGDITIQFVERMDIVSVQEVTAVERKDLLVTATKAEAEQKRVAEIQQLKERLAVLESAGDTVAPTASKKGKK